MKAEIAGAVKDIYLSLNASEAMERMHETVAKYSKKASKFCEWLEENFEQGLTFYNYPREHWKKIRTVNVSERLNQEIKRRTRVARLFPSVESCLRLIASVALEQHEEWVSGKKYMVLD
jgi:transposase-like protein